MKIYDHNPAGAAGPESARVPETQRSGASAASRGSVQVEGGDDHVELSSSLGALSRAVSADQTNRASRIQALTAQVRSGEYRPDARAVSRGMISEALAGGS